MDILADFLASILSVAPYSLMLLLTGAIAGYWLFGLVGLFMGGAVGVLVGAYFDISNGRFVTRHRLRLTLLGIAFSLFVIIAL